MIGSRKSVELGGLALVTRMRYRVRVPANICLRPSRAARDHIDDNGRHGHGEPVPRTVTPHFGEAGLIGDGCRPKIGLTSARVSAHRVTEAPVGRRQSFRRVRNVASFELKKRRILPIAPYRPRISSSPISGEYCAYGRGRPRDRPDRAT